ncbi:MAG: hypothetical protein MUO31_13470, partial [Thermodesulfovibrionales bacterium]|nr:hypothetical protein [Thermodesulfovibrionales bacterium]
KPRVVLFQYFREKFHTGQENRWFSFVMPVVFLKNLRLGRIIALVDTRQIAPGIFRQRLCCIRFLFLLESQLDPIRYMIEVRERKYPSGLQKRSGHKADHLYPLLSTYQIEGKIKGTMWNTGTDQSIDAIVVYDKSPTADKLSEEQAPRRIAEAVLIKVHSIHQLQGLKLIFAKASVLFRFRCVRPGVFLETNGKHSLPGIKITMVNRGRKRLANQTVGVIIRITDPVNGFNTVFNIQLFSYFKPRISKTAVV